MAANDLIIDNQTGDEVQIIERLLANSDQDTLEFCMSDESVDRVGDVIEAAGWQLNKFRKNPIALYGHDRYAPPIGTWEKVRIEGSRLLGHLKLAEPGTSPFIDAIRSLVAQKVLRAVSVGFKPLLKEKLSDKSDEWFGPFRFKKQELLECSLVAVPANSNALALRALSPEVRSMVVAKPGDATVMRSLSASQVSRVLDENARLKREVQRLQPFENEVQRLKNEVLAERRKTDFRQLP